jgi:hypothetical protein
VTLIEFNVKTDCPLASAPEVDGDAKKAHETARAATLDFVSEIERINADQRFSAGGKQAQILKLREEREEKLSEAETLLALETKEVAEFEGILWKDAKLNTPLDPARATAIVTKFQSLDRSHRLAVIRECDGETSRALLRAPKILDLIDDQTRELLTDRLLENTDPVDYERLKERKEGLGRARYAVDTARSWLDKKSGVKSDLRSRIARARA